MPQTNGTLPKMVQLRLTVREPEVVAELAKFPANSREQDDFALAALRIGVLH